MLLCILSGLYSKKVTQIIRRKIHRFRNLMNRQKSFLRRFFIKIIIQKLFKFSQKLMIPTFSGNELSFVKTFGIIQQQFDLRQNNFLRVLVDVLTFFIDFIQNFKQIILSSVSATSPCSVSVCAEQRPGHPRSRRGQG